MSTDRDWESWGKQDPYYGVLSEERFRAGTLTGDRRQDFFRSGEAHVATLLDTIRRMFAADFSPARSLDFGCGVGRLLIPLAQRSAHATGVDVSPSMLAEAAANCGAAGVGNIELVRSDDALSSVGSDYDLVHSHLVFAHIHPTRGLAFIDTLAEKVRPGGFIAVQVPYACSAPRWKRVLVQLRYRVPLLHVLRNVLRGRPPGEPAMQLHVYPLPRLFRMLRRRGFADILVLTDTFADGEFDSAMLLARRDAPAGTGAGAARAS